MEAKIEKIDKLGEGSTQKMNSLIESVSLAKKQLTKSYEERYL